VTITPRTHTTRDARATSGREGEEEGRRGAFGYRDTGNVLDGNGGGGGGGGGGTQLGLKN